MKLISTIFATLIFALGGLASNTDLSLSDEAADYYHENNDQDFEWRYIKGIGWRKFSPEGAMTKDFWDWKKSTKPLDLPRRFRY